MNTYFEFRKLVEIPGDFKIFYHLRPFANLTWLIKIQRNDFEN